MTSYESQLRQVIRSDNYIMTVLKVVESLNLSDGWVAAGLIRNRVWDYLHNETTIINDIDVIYFDSHDISLETEKDLEEKLETLMPTQLWSVKNQARMHLKNDFNSFKSSYDGVAHFPETPTAVAVRLHQNNLMIMAPYGLEDLFEMIVKPTPHFLNNHELQSVYSERMKVKKWKETWNDLLINI